MGPIAAIVIFGILPLGLALFMAGFFVVSVVASALSGVPAYAYAWAFLAATLVFARFALHRTSNVA